MVFEANISREALPGPRCASMKFDFAGSRIPGAASVRLRVLRRTQDFQPVLFWRNTLPARLVAGTEPEVLNRSVYRCAARPLNDRFSCPIHQQSSCINSAIEVVDCNI